MNIGLLVLLLYAYVKSCKRRGQITVSKAIQILKGENTYDLHVMWSIHNKCNYSCTYCPSELNNGDTQWLNFDHLTDFIDKIEEHYVRRLGYKNILFSFTGGEPTLWKDFKPFVKYIGEKGFRCGLTTNGSVSPNFWKNISHVFDYICMSFHPEKAEIEKFLSNYEFLHNEPDTVIPSVRVMMHHEHKLWKKGEKLIKKLKKYPNWTYQSVHILKNYGQGSEKIDYNSKSKDKFLEKNAFREQFKKPEVITEPEVGFNYLLKDDENQVTRLNENQLINNDEVNFNDWNCYIGLESLFIHFSGDVKTAGCQTGRSIGNILYSEDIKFPIKPVKCLDKGCYCPTDIRVTKSAPGLELPYEVKEDFSPLIKVGTDKSMFRYRLLLSITRDLLLEYKASEYVERVRKYIEFISLKKQISTDEICLYISIDDGFDVEREKNIFSLLSSLPGYKALMCRSFEYVDDKIQEHISEGFSWVVLSVKSIEELAIASQLLMKTQKENTCQLIIDFVKGPYDQIKAFQLLKIAMKVNKYFVFQLNNFEEGDLIHSLIKKNGGDPIIRKYEKSENDSFTSVKKEIYLYNENIEFLSGRTSTLNTEKLDGHDKFANWKCFHGQTFSIVDHEGGIFSSNCAQRIKLGHIMDSKYAIDFSMTDVCRQSLCNNIHDQLIFKEKLF